MIECVQKEARIAKEGRNARIIIIISAVCLSLSVNSGVREIDFHVLNPSSLQMGQPTHNTYI